MIFRGYVQIFIIDNAIIKIPLQAVEFRIE